MIQKELIEQIVNEKLAGSEYFLVEVKVSKDDVIDVEIDADEGVNIDFCVELSRFVESRLDREAEDFELNVGSAGLTSPFKVRRQYEKNLGNEVEVLDGEGRKHKGELVSVDEESFSIDETVMERREGDKRKKAYVVNRVFRYSEIKSTHYIIDFK